MTIYDVLAILSLLFAIGINSLLVYLQKKHALYKPFGSRGLGVHSTVLTVVWGGFIYACTQLHQSSWQFEPERLLGAFMIAVALTVFVLSVRQIGTGALVNANFFGEKIRTLKGIYNYIPEPIYASYVVLLAGLGFYSGQVGFLMLSTVAFIGLYTIERAAEQP